MNKDTIRTTEKIKFQSITLVHLESIIKAAQNTGNDGKLILASYGQNPCTGRDIVPKIRHINLEKANIETILKIIETWTKEPHRNVYTPLCLMRPDLPAGRKGGIDDIIAVFGVCADFDDENAVQYLERLPLDPDIVLETSKGRYQAMFLFNSPISIDKAKYIAAMLQKYSGCDHGTKDISHVWRSADTWNYPNKKKVDEGRSPKPQRVKMIKEPGDITTDPDMLEGKLRTWEAHQGINNNDNKHKKSEETASPKLSQWNQKIEDLPLKKETKNKILHGEPVGKRSESMMSVLCGLVFSGLSDIEIFSVFNAYPIGEKYQKQRNPAKWLQPQIDKARAAITDRATQNDLPVQKSSEKEETWEKPVLFEEVNPPELRPDLIPGIIGGMAKAVAVSTETPIELSIGLLLPVLASACHGKIMVEIKDGYQEPVNIWTATSLPPGSRKSSVMKKASNPLNEYETLERQMMEPLVKEATIQRNNEEARLKVLRGKYAKAGPDTIDELKKDIHELEMNITEIPEYPQLWAQDVTPEHLGTLMNNNNGRIAIISAEGGIFDILGGRYSKGVANLDLFLQGHSGDPVRVDRGSRDPVYIGSPALTMGLAVQPDVLRSIADKSSFRGRGLLGRFLYFLPRSNLGYRNLETGPVSDDIKNQYHDLIFTLLDTDQLEVDGVKYPYILQLSRDAYQKWLDYYRTVENELKEGGRFEHITDWAGKLPGATARIAGLLHCAKYPQQPWLENIGEETMKIAIELSLIFESHALIVFEMMGADQGLVHAHKIWRWVERHRHQTFSKRDCFNALQGTFHNVKNMEDPLKVLIERHYLHESQLKTGGRPSIQYAVNPIIINSW